MNKMVILGIVGVVGLVALGSFAVVKHNKKADEQ